MRKNKIVALLLTMTLALSLLLACAGPAEPAEGEMTDIKIMSSSVGTGTYVNIVAMSAMVNAQSEWLRATPIPTPGWIDSLRMLKEGRSDISGTGAINIAAMLKGVDYFEGEQYTDLKWLWPFMVVPMTITTKTDSTFRTIQDLRDATVGTGLPGSALEVDTRALFTALGFEPKKLLNMAYTDMPAALKDGTVNVVIHTQSKGAPGIVEYATVNDCYFIPIDDESWKKVEALDLGYARGTLPKGTYRLQDYDVPTLTKVGYFVTRKDVSEGIIYEVTRCFWTEMLEGKALSLNPKVLGDCKDTCEESIADSGPCPIHPGAEKYFKEIGWL